MKKLLLFAGIMISCYQITAQNISGWRKATSTEISQLQRNRININSDGELYFKADLASMKHALLNIPDKFSNTAGVIISIPNMKGEQEQYKVWENSNFDPALQAQFPDIRAYVGKGITDPQAAINFSMSPAGIQTMVSRIGRGMEFIEAYDKEATSYVLFDSKNRNSGKLPFVCSTVDTNLNQELLDNNNLTNRSSNAVYKTLRLALSCTGEYGVYFGGTVAGALAAMNATMTRVNGVFEIDLAIHMNIIANDTSVIYVNASTDPYSAASGMGNWNSELQANLTSVITSANYDIGHLFGATGGGGNAGCIGCVCVSGTKGSGITSPGSGGPLGDNFDIDYVVHEMGHQLGGNHSFTHGYEGTAAQVEPGSGSTIMGYAGITSYDVQAHSDALFAYKNIAQIQTNLATKTCPVSVTMTDVTPVVNAGADYTIPKGTAFILTGVGSDADSGDALTYTWEENDLGTNATTNANSKVSATKAVGPNFRIFAPVTTPVRYCPQLSKVLLAQLTTATNWESVYTGTANRNFNFTFTARDNHTGGGQTATDAMIVTVDITKGPFAVTSQSTTGITWTGGNQTITWNVLSTTALAGSTNVDILLSTDAGLTFTTVLGAAVPNNGSAVITVPSINASACRIMVKPTGNIYYAVNSKAFAISSPLTVPTFNQVAPICTGGTLSALPTTSTNSITGTWSPAVNNTATTTYTFTPTAGQGASSTTLSITVNQLTVPSFAAVAAICSGSALAALPTTSTNGIAGSWSPAVNNAATTTYTFTPNANQCASTKTMSITVNPMVSPTFAAVPAICSGGSLSALPQSSQNGVTGSWSPAINNTATTTYTFTPGTGQCATTTTLSITVNSNITPTFAAVPSICSGGSLSALPQSSQNGVTGSWSPAINNTATTTYTFTPGTGQCATTAALSVTVNPNIAPNFAQIAALCSGATAPVLASTSPNGVSGSWLPSTVSNTGSGTYSFTPTAGQCALAQSLNVTVNPVTAAPTGTSPQTYMAGDTIEDLTVSGSNILWYYDTGMTLPVPSNTFLQNNAVYYASQTISGCEGTALPITAQLFLRTNDFNSLTLTYSPNPVSAVLSIKSQELLKTVSVYNTLGQNVYKNSINNMNAEVDLSNLASGSYFVKVESGERRNIFKIIKL